MSAFKQSMRKLGIRAGLLAGTSLAVVAIAGVGASSASAACMGTIEGLGSSIQLNAQGSIWSAGFIEAGCGSGENAKPEYHGSSSGTGLEAWGFTGSGSVDRNWSYIGTDDGPNATQITSAKTAAGAGTNVIVVPVAQTAIAILVHPPAECSIEKITNINLEKAFSGQAETWAAIGATGAGCASSLTRVVRTEGSGTTYQFKNYLALINSLRHGGTEAAICTGEPKWSELEEIGPTGAPNTEWPECGLVAPILPTGVGGKNEATKVFETPGTIGYAALTDASGVTTLKVQNNGISGSPIFAKAKMGTEEANCSAAEYTVPAAANPLLGSGVNADWSHVFGGSPSIGGEIYPICTLTYDLAWQNFETAGFGFEETVGKSVKHYYEYIVANGTGTGTVKKWYSNLPCKTGSLEEHNIKLAAEYAIGKIEK